MHDVHLQHNIYLQWAGKMMLNPYLESITGFALFQLPCSDLVGIRQHGLNKQALHLLTQSVNLLHTMVTYVSIYMIVVVHSVHTSCTLSGQVDRSLCNNRCTCNQHLTWGFFWWGLHPLTVMGGEKLQRQ